MSTAEEEGEGKCDGCAAGDALCPYILWALGKAELKEALRLMDEGAACTCYKARAVETAARVTAKMRKQQQDDYDSRNRERKGTR